jgi:tetratricopeptide (TPR) repeat protein
LITPSILFDEVLCRLADQVGCVVNRLGISRYDAAAVDSQRGRMPKPKPNSKPPIPPAVVAACRLQADGRIDEAEAAYRDVLASQPGQIEALDLLAQLRRQRGDLGEALKLYAAMMKADRGAAAAASNHGVVLNELKRPAEALASLDRALILKPDFVPGHYNRGNALMALDRYAEALRSFERALALDPSHVDAHYNRGNALRELRRHDEALAGYRKALTLAPDRADIHVNEALTLLLMGNLPGGFAAYQWRPRGDPAALSGPLWPGPKRLPVKRFFSMPSKALATPCNSSATPHCWPRVAPKSWRWCRPPSSR